MRSGGGLNRRRWLLLGVVTVGAGLVLARADGAWPFPSAPSAVLVVGDSLTVVAAPALASQSAGAKVSLLAAIGASPCDVWDGYRPPGPSGGAVLDYRAAVRADRPKAVVLAFSGNPGTSSHACIPDPNADYGRSELSTAYRSVLLAMGSFASRTGARVYLSAAPPRNPAVPEGWSGGVQHGYNGDPALNSMMQQLATSQRWHYDTGALRALTGPQGEWAAYLPCVPADGAGCVGGRVRVRAGGADAIHVDASGTNGADVPSAGSLRYAYGLLAEPLQDQGLHPRGLLEAPAPS